MNHTSSTLRIAAALVAAAFLAACSGGHDSSASVPAPIPTQTATVAFSAFAQDIFAAPANSTPATVNGVNLVFDVDNSPMAFAALLM